MDLITPKQLVKANKYLQYFGGETLAKVLFRILKFNKLNKEYGEICHLPAQEFIGQVMEKVEFGFQVDDNELENIPK
ncbi:MAG: hypothetical protein ISR57_07010, partial [Bacteroidales bacterium]|nr:hypothetical protein [Bacteroidales bacterium]